MELREQLDALSDERAALASRNAILEKVFSMRARVDASVRPFPSGPCSVPLAARAAHVPESLDERHGCL